MYNCWSLGCHVWSQIESLIIDTYQHSMIPLTTYITPNGISNLLNIISGIFDLTFFIFDEAKFLFKVHHFILILWKRLYASTQISNHWETANILLKVTYIRPRIFKISQSLKVSSWNMKFGMQVDLVDFSNKKNNISDFGFFSIYNLKIDDEHSRQKLH